MNNEFKTIRYEDGEINIDVVISQNNVWLSANQIALLYKKDYKTIKKHISKSLNEEYKGATVAKFEIVQLEGKRNVSRLIEHYNLDLILSVGNHVKSNQGIKFKEWAGQQLNNTKIQKHLENTSLIQFRYDEIVLDVTVSPDGDTVWLSKDQLALLFDTTRQNIEYHINNIYAQNEYEIEATCKEILQVQIEGGRKIAREFLYYNLDIIISLGYRINTKNGIIFRKWANKILKEYLLYGYAINEERCLSCTTNIISIQNEMKNLKEKIQKLEDNYYLENSKIFHQGELVEAYSFLRKLFFLAKNEIIISDYYADKFLLTLLSDIKVNIKIITSSSSYLNKEIIPDNIEIIKDDDVHGRNIIIDDKCYIIDNSFNNIGKKKTTIMRNDDFKKEILLKKEK